MQIIGPDGLEPEVLERDLPRVVSLLQGVPAGRVVVATRSDGALARVVLGAMVSRRVVLPLDPLAPAREVEPLLAGAGLLVLDPEAQARWPVPPGAAALQVAPDARPSAWQRLVGRGGAVTSFPGCLAALPSSPLTPFAGDEVSLLLGTSGTTGAPRLVPWTRGALEAQQRTLAEALEVGPAARVMNLLPMHHYDGLVMGLLLARHAGCALIRERAPVLNRLADVLDTVWRERVSHLVLTPVVLSMLLRLGEDLRELFGNRHFRMFVSTAAPLPEGLWRRVEEATGRPVVNVYGLTETGNLLFAGPDPASRRIGTVGRPRDCAIRVIDEQGADVAPGQPGELLLRGSSVMHRFLDGSSPLLQGCYPTGDRVVVDPDGCVRILGRIRSTVSVGGLKVEPAEVERALLEHPQVRDARVTGEPDPVWGERLSATVVADGVGEAELVPFLRERLSEHKVPRAWRVVDHLGRGETGKPRAGADESVEARVIAVACQVFRAPPGSLSLSARAGDVPGWDSLGHLDLVEALERVFGVVIAGRALMRLRSLADAVALIEGSAGG